MVVVSVVFAERYNSPLTAIPGCWYFLVTHEQKNTVASANRLNLLFNEYLGDVFVVIKIQFYRLFDGCRFNRRLPAYTFLYILENNKQHWYHKHAEDRPDQHTADCTCANGPVSFRSCSGRYHQRHN